MSQPSSFSGVAAWALNIVSSVGIIMVNKQVMTGYGFVYATTLSGMHFVVTGIVGAISSALGYSSAKVAVPFLELVWFTILANMSVVGMNSSLMLNSVGFYQIAKLSIIPTVCVFETLLNSKSYTREVKLSVVVVMLGVGVCTVTDIDIRPAGLVAAVVAVVTTALQQILIGSLQKKYNIGSMDLLSQTAPLQAVSLVAMGPLADYFLQSANILKYNFTPMATVFVIEQYCALLFALVPYPVQVFILASCILAVLVNLSQYLCIGKFSATTFQVLGHMKTILVLLLGWLLFNSRVTLKLLAGMVVAVAGMVLYSWAAEKAKKQEKEAQGENPERAHVSPLHGTAEGETAPLMGSDVEAGKD